MFGGNDDAAAWEMVDTIVEHCGRYLPAHTVPRRLAALTLKHVFRNPKFGFEPDGDGDGRLSEDEAGRLVTICQDRILNNHEPVMEILRMQTTFLGRYLSHSETLRRHRRDVEQRSAPLTREICESADARTRDDLEALRTKVVACIVLRSGLGNPADATVAREAGAALASVFTQNDLSAFSTQSRLDKKARLRELSAVVAGIRVFNWDFGKNHPHGGIGDGKTDGGGVDDLPAMLNSALDATMANLDAARMYTADKVQKYTALVEKLLYTECGLGVAEAEVNRFKYALVLLRQFQALLTVLQSDAAACANRIAALDQDLLGNLTELGLAMADKGGDSRRRLQTHLLQVPRDRVCPQFARLAKTWQGFQEEAVVLSKVNAMREALHKHIAHLKQLPLKRMMIKYEVNDVTTDDERHQENCEGSVEVDQFEEGCVLVYPTDMGGPGKRSVLDLSLGGFCPVAMVSGQAFLLPGNPRLGLLRFKGRHYSCSSVDRAQQFGKSPAIFVGAVERLVRENPCLEHLLGMGEEDAAEGHVGAAAAKAITADLSVQTPTHLGPESGEWNPNYKWNEWDMRRDALKLAQRSEKSGGLRSHYVQTEGSNGAKKEIAAQVSSSHHHQIMPFSHASSERSTQTSRESATSMDINRKKKSIVVGLKSKNGTAVKHVLLEDLLANI